MLFINKINEYNLYVNTRAAAIPHNNRASSPWPYSRNKVVSSQSRGVVYTKSLQNRDRINNKYKRIPRVLRTYRYINFIRTCRYISIITIIVAIVVVVVVVVLGTCVQSTKNCARVIFHRSVMFRGVNVPHVKITRVKRPNLGNDGKIIVHRNLNNSNFRYFRRKCRPKTRVQNAHEWYTTYLRNFSRN